jgi:hypothetical protein
MMRQSAAVLRRSAAVQTAPRCYSADFIDENTQLRWFRLLHCGGSHKSMKLLVRRSCGGGAVLSPHTPLGAMRRFRRHCANEEATKRFRTKTAPVMKNRGFARRLLRKRMSRPDCAETTCFATAKDGKDFQPCQQMRL